MKKIVVIFMFVFFMIIVWGCGDSSEVKMVKGGTLQLCPNSTVEKMVNGFMGTPKWESGKADDGKEFVNVTGGITLYEKPVTAKVQFLIDKKNNTFEYYAFEINEVPQNNLMAMALLGKMCESTVK